MRNNPTVAIVDDDESVRDTTKDLLDSAGLSAATFDSAQSFLQSKGTCAIRCLIADMRMPGMTGLELHSRLAAAGTPIPTVLITAYPDELARAGLEDGRDLLSRKALQCGRPPRLHRDRPARTRSRVRRTTLPPGAASSK